METETVESLRAERDRLLEVLKKVGGLCRWVGWLESRFESAGRDMRTIQEPVAAATGSDFEEHT